MIRIVYTTVLLAAAMMVPFGAGAQAPYSPGQTFSAGADPTATAAPARGQNFYGGQQRVYTAPVQQQQRPVQRPAGTPYNMERTPAPRSTERATVRKATPATPRASSKSKSANEVSEVKKSAPAKSVVQAMAEKAEEPVSETKAETVSSDAKPDATPVAAVADSKPDATPAAAVADAKPAVVDSNDKLVFSSRKTGKKWIALTYDDGPNPNLTPKLSEYLKANNVPATFYVLGEMVKAQPAMVKKLAEDGFELANHTYSHPDLRKQSEEKILKELQDTHDLIKQASGVDMKTMRPPYGARNSKVDAVCEKMGYKIVLWDVDTEDWRNRSTDSMMNTIIKQTGDGSIILMHDRKHNGRETVFDVTKKTVEHYRAQGYTFVTVTQLLGLGGAVVAAEEESRAAVQTGTLALLGASATTSTAVADQPLPTPAIMTPAPALP